MLEVMNEREIKERIKTSVENMQTFLKDYSEIDPKVETTLRIFANDMSAIEK